MKFFLKIPFMRLIIRRLPNIRLKFIIDPTRFARVPRGGLKGHACRALGGQLEEKGECVGAEFSEEAFLGDSSCI